MASALKNLSPIRACGEVLPPPQLFENIPMLHWFLTEVLEDWLRAVGPYQEQVDNAEDEAAMIYAFVDLQSMFLKCLFSYAFFFVSADNAYAFFYKKLNRANFLSGLRLKHGKPPKKTSLVCKLRRIRNISIAHFPSDDANPIDAFAGMSWTPMSLSSSSGGRVDLEKLTFVPGRFRGIDASGQSIESEDFEISGIRTLHQHCMSYLEQYDQICCDYLGGLKIAIGT